MVARWSGRLAVVAAVAGVGAAVLAPLAARPFARGTTLLLSLAAVLGGIVSLILNAASFRSTTPAATAVVAALAVAGLGLGAVAPEMLRICCGAEIGAASAIGVVRAVTSGQATFAATCGGGGYAASLRDLAKAPPGGGLGFVSPDLDVDVVVRGEYVITLRQGLDATVVTPAGDTCNRGTGDAVSSYFVEAHPVPPRRGLPSFASDARGLIYSDASGTTIKPGMAGATPLR
jgi:hypothetical protein